MHMLEKEAGMTTKSRARYLVKRLDNGIILYFTDRESAQIYSIDMHDNGICCAIREIAREE